MAKKKSYPSKAKAPRSKAKRKTAKRKKAPKAATTHIRTIYLPAIEKRVSIKAYIAGIRLAKQNPDKEFRHGLTCWWPCTGQDILLQFLEGIHDRINQGIPYMERK